MDDANVEQREYWNQAEHWVRERDLYDGMLAPFTERLLDAAAPRDDEDLVDVGCGTGATTCRAARLVHHALGVDIATPMVEAARERATAERIDNVEFLVADAQTHPFPPSSLDLVISRFGVMFFADPVAAFANLRAALGPGGRTVFVCWQELAANEWMMVPIAAALAHVPAPEPVPPGTPGPFAFGDRDRLHSVLTDAGFGRIEIEPAAESLVVDRDVDAAAEFYQHSGMARRLLADLPPDVVGRVVDAIRDAIEPHASADGVRLGGAAWVVRARAS